MSPTGVSEREAFANYVGRVTSEARNERLLRYASMSDVLRHPETISQLSGVRAGIFGFTDYRVHHYTGRERMSKISIALYSR